MSDSASIEELSELMQFIDDRPDLTEDELLNEIEKRFSKEAMADFTALFFGKKSVGGGVRSPT